MLAYTSTNCDKPRPAHSKPHGGRSARNVWKFVTVTAVSHAIHTITGIPNSELSIKRKFRHNEEKKVTSWWFVIPGKDAVLEELDSKWPQIQLQTNWELKPLLAYGDVTPGPEPEGLPRTDEATETSQEGIYQYR